MLPKFDSHLQTLVVRDVVIVVTANHRIHHVEVASEHLVEMSTLPMGLSATHYCQGEVALCQ
jgi:hypothetical protein